MIEALQGGGAMKKILVYLLSCSLLLQTACSMSGMQIGALTGAGVGGVVGGLVDTRSPLRGALIGAAVGALAGLAIGYYVDTQTRTAAETARQYHYEPSQGTMVQIEDVRMEPSTVRPGASTKLVMDYALLDRNPDRRFQVREKRIIKSNNRSLKEIGPAVKSRSAGTYTTEQEVVFPSNLPEGAYALRGQVEADGRSSSKESLFQVVRLPGSPERYAFLRIPETVHHQAIP
jgi:hypothetical protein